MKILTLLLVSFALSACVAVRPFEKQYLLDPSMDDATAQSMEGTMPDQTALANEKLATGKPGQGGSACPTCGG